MEDQIWRIWGQILVRMDSAPIRRIWAPIRRIWPYIRQIWSSIQRFPKFGLTITSIWGLGTHAWSDYANRGNLEWPHSTNDGNSSNGDLDSTNQKCQFVELRSQFSLWKVPSSNWDRNSTNWPFWFVESRSFEVSPILEVALGVNLTHIKAREWKKSLPLHVPILRQCLPIPGNFRRLHLLLKMYCTCFLNRENRTFLTNSRVETPEFAFVNL